MKITPNRLRLLIPGLLLAAGTVLAQSPPPPHQPTTAPADLEKPVPTNLETYEDFSVKAYRLEFFGGRFSGGTYLDNKPISNRTVIEVGKDPIYAFQPDGSGILVSGLRVEKGVIIYPHRDNDKPNSAFFDAARKEIKPGPVYGGRIGIYIADDFHLDIVASYASGNAVTTMLYDADGEAGNDYQETRVTVEEDTGFKVYRGGLDLMYDARPATFLGLTPHLGFGLGGIINRYSYLDDKTGLYLKGNFGLSAHLAHNLDLYARAGVSTFAFHVDELGYSNMVSYTNLTLGLSWFQDVLPPAIRAKHEADLAN